MTSLVLLLLVITVPPDSIHVRGLGRDTTLAVLGTAAGGALRADEVLPLVGGVARVTGFGRWTIEGQGFSIGLVDGVPFATSKGVTFPLAVAPRQQDGAFLLPIQLLAELVPRLGNGISWDPVRRELGVTRLTAARTPTQTPTLPASISSPRPTSSIRAPDSPRAPPTRRWTVVVDAGHGGVDPGMRGPIGGRITLYEKDITLGVSRRLARELEARGVSVVMTRTTDTLIALSDRGRIANQHQGDLFLSIHVNAANPNWKDPRSARGFETYFLAEAKTEDDRRVAEMENEVVRFETTQAGPHDGALGFILSDMKQNEHLRESNDLAQSVQGHLAGIHPGPSRGVKQAGFRVLVTSFMPSVLIEIGFGTNPAEAAWITGADGQSAIAAAVADAAMAYLAGYERRVSGTGGMTSAAAAPRR